MSRFYMPRVQWFNGNGNPLVNGQLTFFAAGTDTPLDVWNSADMDVAHLQPVTADSDGKWPAIFLTDGVAYKVVLKNSAGAVIFTEDDVVEGFTLTQLQGVQTNDDIEDTDTGGASYIRTAGDTEVGDHGATLWKKVEVEPEHDGKKQSEDGFWYEHADPYVIPAQFGDDNNLAAQIAFDLDKPLMLDEGHAIFPVTSADAEEDTDMSRHAYFMRVCKWQGSCICFGSSRVKIQIDGFYKVAAWKALGADTPVIADSPVIYRDHQSPAFSLIAESSQEISIASVTYGARSGNVYPVTIVAAAALPAYVVSGYALGTRNITGNNDADALSGAIEVKTISGDRLTITCDLICGRTSDLISPTTIDTTTVYQGMNPSRLVVPSGCLGIDTAYEGATELWTGADHEAYFIFRNGGTGEFQNIGMTWNGLSGTGMDQDIIFGIGANSYIELYDQVVIAGAGDRIMRLHAGAGTLINRSCLGGGGTAQTGVTVSAGAKVVFIRVSAGGFAVNAVAINNGGHGTLSASVFSSCAAAMLVSGVGASALLGTTKVACSFRGCYAQFGELQVLSNVTLRANSLALDWDALGFIHGNPAFASNTTDASNPPQVESNGGGWYAEIIENLSRNRGRSITITSNHKARFLLTRAGGRVMTAFSNYTDYWANFYVENSGAPALIADTNAGANVTVDAASTVPFDLGALPINAGDMSYRVVVDTGVNYLEILNETGSSRTAWVSAGVPGDLSIGLPALI